LSVTAFARATLNRMTDEELNGLISAIGTNDSVRAAVETHGDTAYQSRLIFPLLRQSLHPSRFAVMSGAMFKALRFGLRALWDDGAHLARHDGNRASGFGTRKGEDSDQREPIGRSGGLTP